VPKYDFRCDDCGQVFELSRSFGQVAAPATCPHDGAAATRLFSPPLDLLVYGREPAVSTGRVTIPPDALSCHDHGPPPGPEASEQRGRTGSRWHAHGYENASAGDENSRGSGAVPLSQSHSHGSGLQHSHASGHRHHQH
jgi:putative FmdB family regulatory protein